MALIIAHVLRWDYSGLELRKKQTELLKLRLQHI